MNVGNGIINNSRPIWGFTGNYAAGNIPNTESVYGEILNSGTGIITNAKALEANINTATPANITNGYGLYINDIQATNQWGVYQAGSDDNNYFAANTKIGSNNATLKNYKLAVESTVNATTGATSITNAGSFFKTIMAPSAPSASYYSGNITLVEANSPNMASAIIAGIVPRVITTGNNDYNALVGINSFVTNNSSGNVGDIVASDNAPIHSGTGVVAKLIGSPDAIYNSGTGTVTDAYNIKIESTNTGTINNGYGIHISDIKATNDWGVYQESPDDNNYFNGNTGLKTNNPQAVFDIAALNDRGMLIRSGNSSNNFANSQISFGWNNTTDYRHSIKTRHNSAGGANNALDFFLWDNSVAVSANPTLNALSITNLGNIGAIGVNQPNPRAELDVVGTGAIIVPAGTTAQQPTTAVFGMVRYNSTIGRGEMYVNDVNGDGTQGDAGWRPF